MYEDLISRIQQDISEFTTLERALVYLEKRFNQFTKLLTTTDAAIKELDTQRDTNVSEIVLADAFAILEKYALAAIRDTVEFNIGEYRLALINAVRDKRTIKILADPDKVRVRINLDLTAGNLNDYADGIKRARNILKVGFKKPNPMEASLASYMWMEKYYRPAREGTDIPQPKRDGDKGIDKRTGKDKKPRVYNKTKYINAYKRTMKTRLSSFKKPAPFWRIINDGTPGTLESGNEGTPYPIVKPSRFVEKAKRRIEERLSTQFKKSSDSEAELRRKRQAIQKTLAFIEGEITRITAELGDPKTRKQFAIKKIYERLGQNFSNADMKKLLGVAEELASGGYDPTRRAELTRRGAAKRIRPRMAELVRMVSQFIEQ